MLQQLGLLPEGLPVAGAEQALKAADPKAVPSNSLIMRGSAPAARCAASPWHALARPELGYLFE